MTVHLTPSVELDLEFYESSEYHDAHHRAQAEAPVRPTRIVTAFAQIGQAGLSLIAVMGLLVSFHWVLLVALLGAALPGLVVKTRYSSRMYLWTRKRTTVERLTRYLNYVLTSIDTAKEIRIFGLGDVFRGRHRTLRRQVIDERLRLARARCSRSATPSARSSAPRGPSRRQRGGPASTSAPGRSPGPGWRAWRPRPACRPRAGRWS